MQSTAPPSAVTGNGSVSHSQDRGEGLARRRQMTRAQQIRDGKRHRRQACTGNPAPPLEGGLARRDHLDWRSVTMRIGLNVAVGHQRPSIAGG